MPKKQRSHFAPWKMRLSMQPLPSDRTGTSRCDTMHESICVRRLPPRAPTIPALGYFRHIVSVSRFRSKMRSARITSCVCDSCEMSSSMKFSTRNKRGHGKDLSALLSEGGNHWHCRPSNAAKTRKSVDRNPRSPLARDTSSRPSPRSC